MGKKRGKYKPKEENIKKLYAFLKKISDEKNNNNGSNIQHSNTI